MAVKANALISLAQAKDYLDIQTSDTSQDSRVEGYIDAASQFIQEYCNRNFISQSYTEYQDGRQSNQILLRQWPATKPSDLRIDNSREFGSNTVVDTADYDVIEGNILLLVNRFFPNGYGNIKIVYTAGYGTVAGNTLPSDIQLACKQLVAWYSQERTDRRTGVTSRGKNGENISFEIDVPKKVISVLERYKRFEFSPANASIRND